MKTYFVVFIIAALLAASTLVAAVQLTDTQAQGLFVEFCKRYNKSYELGGASDFFKRFQIFRDNVQWIVDFNDNKSNTHQVGVNYFADMTPEEWVHFKGLKMPQGWAEPNFAEKDKLADKDDAMLMEVRHAKNYGLTDNYDVLKDDKVPKAVNWVENGTMLPIRNQGSCGSCYSYSAMSTVEALHKITYPTEESPGFFSTQQGVDCTGNRYGCSYCQGGWMTSVFDYLIDNKGVCSDESYPYKNKRTACQDKTCEKVFAFNKYRDISGSKESTIREHLAVNPLAIAVTSGTREFMYYKSGVITNCGGSGNQQIDHAVTMVGYDSQPADGVAPYFLIRNSWGAQWGEAGHVRVASASNTCKHRTNLSYPVMGPQPQSQPTQPAQPAQPTAQPQPTQQPPLVR